MTAHSFIVNINNALDMAHFCMYFYRGISQGTISLIELDEISDESIRSIPEKVNKFLNRNSFEADNISIIICIERDCTGGSPLLCDLYIKSWLIRFFGETWLDRTELVIINKYQGIQSASELKLRDRCNRVNQEMDSHGFLEHEDDALFFTLFPAAADFGSSQLPTTSSRFAFHSGIYQSFTAAFTGEKDKSLDNYNIEFMNMKSKIARIRTASIDIDLKSTESSIVQQMRICRFMLRRDHESRESLKYQTEFDTFCRNSFQEEAEASNLLALRQTIQFLKKRFDLQKVSSEISLQYQTMDLIPQIYSEEEIGGSNDTKRMMKRLNSGKNYDNWEDDYFAVIKQLEEFEQRLEAYGKKISEEFHSENRLVSETKEYSSYDEARKTVDEKLQDAAEQFYSLKSSEDDKYAKILNISNQFQIIHSEIIKINECRKSNRWEVFFPFLIAALIAVIIPYVISQTYIFSAILKGEIVPLINVLLFLAVFFIAKGAVKIRLSILLRKEIKKLRRFLEEYLGGLKLRQEQFMNTMNAMIKIHNAKAEEEALDKESASQELKHRKRMYYKEKLDEMEHRLHYFDSFMENRGTGEIIPLRDATELDFSKGVTDNEAFWL